MRILQKVLLEIALTESDIIIDLRNLNEKPKNTYDVLKHSNIPNSFFELEKIVLLYKAVSVVDLETLKKLKTFTLVFSSSFCRK